MLQIGIRAHDMGQLPAEELANAVSIPGVSAIQLAPSKALVPPCWDPASLARAERRAIAGAFSQRGISVAVLGCYINPVHPNPAARAAGLERFAHHLRTAGDFNCPVVGTETGSIDPDCNYHPDTALESTYLTLVESVRGLARIAEENGGVTVGIEPVADTHTISTALLMKQLLDDVDSPAIGVIFDPVNMVPDSGVLEQEQIMDACFAAFGSRIVAVHAKDYRIEQDGRGLRKVHPLPAGTGRMDWPGFFRRLQAAGKQDVPVLLENAGPAEAPGAIAHLRDAWVQSTGKATLA